MASYLQYRVAHEPSHGNPMLNCIKQLANAIYIDSDSEHRSLDMCIEKLCSMSMIYSNNKRPAYREIFERTEQVSEKEYDAHLLGAALCTNSLATVRRCAAKDTQLLLGMKQYSRSDLFSPYLELAARYGDEALLRFLMTCDTSTLNRKMRAMLFVFTAQAGQLKLMEFVYNFQRTEYPWEFGRRESEHDYEARALYGANQSSHLETMEFVESLRKMYPTWPNDRLHLDLRLSRSILRGSVDSTAYLLNHGAQATGWSMHAPYTTQSVVIEACTCVRGDIAVVDLLIQHGADPSVTIAAAASRGRTSLVRELLDRDIKPKQALAGAAKGPYLDTVRLLLDAGVDVNEDSDKKIGSPLVNAISLEHTQLFRLLMERGADLNAPGITEECVNRARQDGLESMLELLEEYGVDVTSIS